MRRRNGELKRDSVLLDRLTGRTPCRWPLLTCMLLVAVAAPAQESVAVPAGAPLGLFLNAWAEEYDGSRQPTFRPAEFLQTNTNYRFVVDVAAIPYAGQPGVGVVSIPLRGGYPEPVLIEIVVEDERYHPQSDDYFFSIHGFRAQVTLFDFDLRQEGLSRLRPEPVGAEALELLHDTVFDPPWLFGRGVFLVRTRDRDGAAPLGILLRAPSPSDDLLDVVSTRFCVGHPDRAFDCTGLPRQSEYMGYAIGSEPPPFPADSEILSPTRYEATIDGHGDTAEREWTWNSWLSRYGDRGDTPVKHLILDDRPPQSTYVLHVDAALYYYFSELGLLPGEVGHAPGDPILRELARDRLERGDTTLRLVVRTEAVGNAVEITGRRSQTIDVDLTRLDPDRPPPLPTDDGQLTIKALSSLAAATSIRVTVTPVGAGCGAVALSLSDESGRRPVDHLVHYLEVRRPSEAATGCGSNGLQTALSSGVRTILAPGGAPPADAALHVFELFPESSDEAAAFFIGPGDEYYSWELGRPITQYLGDAGNLEARISEARERTKQGVEHAYDRAAQELAGALFSGANPSEQAKADAARQALRDFVARSPRTPTLLARLTDWRGKVLFLPLGLLSAPGQHPVLEKPINVVLPLPIEDFQEAGCLRTWTVAVSDDLEGADARVPEDVRGDDAWLGDSLEDLRHYLGDSRHFDGEGVVLVAHHAGGRLRYRESDFPIQAQEVKRDYGESSAAVLAICGAGGVDPVDSLFLRRLNQFGLDAAIVSPFSLDANYGKVFAIEFSRIVRGARAAGREATLGELFHEAVSATAATMKDHPNPRVKGSVGDMGLELILVGNPSLQLCKE